MKNALIAAGVVVVLGIVLWPSLRSADGGGKAVEVERVARRTVVACVKASGEINPKVKVKIQSKAIEVATGPYRVLCAPRAGDPVRREKKKEGSTLSQS